MDIPISILILTKNEENDLPGCLESVSWSNDIHVFDSYSTDRTIEIAQTFGANVIQRTFDNWSSHQNWGLKNIHFQYQWVYYSDADERVTPELVEHMYEAIAKSDECAAYRIKRRDFLGDTWLKHTAQSPFNIRLFKPEKIHYERLINPITVVNGPVKDIDAYFNHFPFSKGMSHWIARHNGYSSLEATQIVNNKRANVKYSLKKALTAADRNERRFHQKELFYHLPARPFVKFLLLYILKGGFLDGKEGFTYATLQSIYEYMIVLKTRELEKVCEQNIVK